MSDDHRSVAEYWITHGGGDHLEFSRCVAHGCPVPPSRWLVTDPVHVGIRPRLRVPVCTRHARSLPEDQPLLGWCLEYTAEETRQLLGKGDRMPGGVRTADGVVTYNVPPCETCAPPAWPKDHEGPCRPQVVDTARLARVAARRYYDGVTGEQGPA